MDYTHPANRKGLNTCCLPERRWQLLSATERNAGGGNHARDHSNARRILQDTNEMRWASEKRRGMLTYGAVLPENGCSHSSVAEGFQLASCLTTFLTALTSLRATTANLPISRSVWDHGSSTIMSWWKVSKHGWSHRPQTSLTEEYKNLLPRHKFLNLRGDYVEK
jgi:hypothetical protein